MLKTVSISRNGAMGRAIRMPNNLGIPGVRFSKYLIFEKKCVGSICVVKLTQKVILLKC
jgi:hypothetical protein